ncbi:hypothetical protein [Heterosigma akashiwo virus 01]|uniref:Uncharacterized protein n=1 Tax=Heterosigma akashiwo virus 01 TaxID=97195 RepID=A0A1C9C5A1_HAV01|nr:hypothetical protein D1R72_gp141 [Heterosigma akashiwo virus 01]AOM63472.1 hypothetical protein [Heterosigma akashiwo virus 01]
MIENEKYIIIISRTVKILYTITFLESALSVLICYLDNMFISISYTFVFVCTVVLSLFVKNIETSHKIDDSLNTVIDEIKNLKQFSLNEINTLEDEKMNMHIEHKEHILALMEIGKSQKIYEKHKKKKTKDNNYIRKSRPCPLLCQPYQYNYK